MLLTRKACYGLIAAKHLAEHAGESSFSANDLARVCGLPHETLAKILQRLTMAGVLTSHHGIRGGYTLARDPRYISVFDVIEASDRPGRSRPLGKRQQSSGDRSGYHPIRMVSQVVEDVLHEITIEDIEKGLFPPRLRASVAASQLRGCALFVYTDRPFAIHYVDDAGKRSRRTKL